MWQSFRLGDQSDQDQTWYVGLLVKGVPLTRVLVGDGERGEEAARRIADSMNVYLAGPERRGPDLSTFDLSVVATLLDAVAAGTIPDGAVPVALTAETWRQVAAAIRRDVGSPTLKDRVVAFWNTYAVDDPTDVEERRDRFIEEALELYQAAEGTPEALAPLVERVFSRPVGDAVVEAGSAMMTLVALVAWLGYDALREGEAELRRCMTPERVAKMRRKRAGRHRSEGALPGEDPTERGA